MASDQVSDPRERGSRGDVNQLWRQLERVFDQFGRSPRLDFGNPYPPINIYDAQDAFVLTAEIPGVSSEDLEITIEGTRVTLRGERVIAYADDGKSAVHRRERQAGIFRRAFDLPVPADSDKAEATCRNGVLMLRIPKAEAHRPRTISVRAS